jgi:uncharacterized DUF497 family protein
MGFPGGAVEGGEGRWALLCRGRGDLATQFDRFSSWRWPGVAAAEQVFFNRPLLAVDLKHSHSEQRFHALGKDKSGRRLHLTFTLREGGSKIRVISARDMHRKERLVHDQQG